MRELVAIGEPRPGVSVELYNNGDKPDPWAFRAWVYVDGKQTGNHVGAASLVDGIDHFGRFMKMFRPKQ